MSQASMTNAGASNALAGTIALMLLRLTLVGVAATLVAVVGNIVLTAIR